MAEPQHTTPQTEADEAVARRLARLAAMPVDTSRLDAALLAAIPRRPARLAMWLRPARAVAALLAVAVVVGLVTWTLSGGPAVASAQEMARIHDDMVAGRIAITRVDSLEEASRVLSQQWAEGPSLPQMPAGHAMACCMASVGGKRMAWVMFRDDQTPITLAVARASDMRVPAGPLQVHHGVWYHVQSTGVLNMVSAQRDDRWICLIGAVSTDRLIEIAANLRF